MYYEPHCDAQASALQRLDPVDIIVTPAVNQMLISFPLVSFCEGGCLTAGCGSVLLCTVACQSLHAACLVQPAKPVVQQRAEQSGPAAVA